VIRENAGTSVVNDIRLLEFLRTLASLLKSLFLSLWFELLPDLVPKDGAEALESSPLLLLELQQGWRDARVGFFGWSL